MCWIAKHPASFLGEWGWRPPTLEAGLNGCVYTIWTTGLSGFACGGHSGLLFRKTTCYRQMRRQKICLAGRPLGGMVGPCTCVFACAPSGVPWRMCRCFLFDGDERGHPLWRALIMQAVIQVSGMKPFSAGRFSACALRPGAAGHLFQFVPRLGWMLLKKIGPSRARAVKEGRSGYNYRVVTDRPK